MSERMKRLAAEVAHLVVTVDSRDRTVTVELSGGEKLSVRLARGALDRHTEESLAREINAALAVAMQTFRDAYRQLRRDTLT